MRQSRGDGGRWGGRGGTGSGGRQEVLLPGLPPPSCFAPTAHIFPGALYLPTAAALQHAGPPASLTIVLREGLLSWKRSPPSSTKSALLAAATSNTSSKDRKESSLRISSFSHTPCSQAGRRDVIGRAVLQGVAAQGEAAAEVAAARHKAPAGQQRTRWLSVEIRMRKTLSLQTAGGQGAQHAGYL